MKITQRFFANLFKVGLVSAYTLFFTYQVSAQSEVPLTDLSYFKNPGKSWLIAGDVSADLNKNNTLTTSQGTGILVNLPGTQAPGADLFASSEHGDADVELDFMMAKGSNSGIYLQGRYEVQLLDSWTAKTPGSGDLGGIYE